MKLETFLRGRGELVLARSEEFVDSTTGSRHGVRAATPGARAHSDVMNHSTRFGLFAAGEWFMTSECARAHFAGELSQPERGVEPGCGIDELFGTGEHQFAAATQEGLELHKNRLEIDGMTAVLPNACLKRGKTCTRIGGRRNKFRAGRQLSASTIAVTKPTAIVCGTLS